MSDHDEHPTTRLPACDIETTAEYDVVDTRAAEAGLSDGELAAGDEVDIEQASVDGSETIEYPAITDDMLARRMRPMTTDCAVCGTNDHRFWTCPCKCHPENERHGS